MKRVPVTPRHEWLPYIKTTGGLRYNDCIHPDGSITSYWKEAAHYSFTLEEIGILDQAARVVFEMLIEAGDYLLAHPELMKKMQIPEQFFAAIRETWDEEPAWGSVYGRYDFRFGGINNPDEALRMPKLYEFNADTPTCLVESAYTQYDWLETTGHGNDQWNFIFEALVAAWQRNLSLIEEKIGRRPLVHFVCSAHEETGEDELNTLMLLEACKKAGYEVETLYLENIITGDDGRFYQRVGNTFVHLDVVFKLFPWEHMVLGRDADLLAADMAAVGQRAADGSYTGGTIWIEAIYKMLWSNKGILPVLWQLFGKDPEKSKYLIPAWFDGEQPDNLANYVRKPLLSREGGNVEVHTPSGVSTMPGEYGEEGYIIQAYAPPPTFSSEDGEVHPVMGVWMIDGEPQGLGIRESKGVVTDNCSSFVPHSISDGLVTYVKRQYIPVVANKAMPEIPAYAQFNAPSL